MQFVTMLRYGAALLTLLAILAGGKHAYAHAVPESANPPIDGVVTDAPSRVEVVFTEEIVPDETTLEVFSLAGARADRGDVEADLDDPERRRVSIGLDPDIASGRYIVQWTSRSAIDDDQVSGSFGFAVDPSATPVASLIVNGAAATPSPVRAAEEAAAAQEDDYDGLSTALLIGSGAAVVAIAALALVVWRSRTSSESEQSQL